MFIRYILKINVLIFTVKVASIVQVEKPEAKILVFGNPSNTNSLISISQKESLTKT